MRKSIQRVLSVSAIVALCWGCASTASASDTGLADGYAEQAADLGKRGRYSEAAQMFEKAVEAERATEDPRLSALADWLSSKAFCLYELGQYDQVMKDLQDALTINRKLGREEGVARGLNNIAAICRSRAQYSEALGYLHEALAINQRLNRESDVAKCLKNIGVLHIALGSYDRGIRRLKEALAINRAAGAHGGVVSCLKGIGGACESLGRLAYAMAAYEEAVAVSRNQGRIGDEAACLRSIGSIHESLGRPDEALRAYQESLAIERREGRENEVVVCLNGIARTEASLGRFDEALQRYQESLGLGRKLGAEREVAASLAGMGALFRSLGEERDAEKSFLQALTISRTLGREGDVAACLRNLGSIYQSWGRPADALKNYRESLGIERRQRRENEIGVCLSSIGSILLSLGQTAEAVESLQAAIGIFGKLHGIAKGRIAGVSSRYLAPEINALQLLLLGYVRQGDAERALQTAEVAAGKVLESEISGMPVRHVAQEADVDVWQEAVPGGTAMVRFANMRRDESVRIVISRNGLDVVEVPATSFLESVESSYGKAIAALANETRRVVESKSPVVGAVSFEKAQSAPCRFTAVLIYYRHLLSIAHKTREQQAAMVDIAKRLYTFLFGQVERQIAGKEALLILPGGILGYLPFETLVTPDGKYLGHRCRITYAHSLGIQERIRKRKPSGSRRPVFAVGGAVYARRGKQESRGAAKQTKGGSRHESDGHVTNRRSGVLRDFYAQLKYDQWGELAGSLDEAEEVSRLMPSGRLIKGEAASESTIKALSASGELSRYGVLHFATHGIVVPEISRLSAVVLSQGVDATEDGYLSARDIAGLDINADFVCLSAIQTGTGAIYDGAGIAGLTQAFLLAGADGVCLSLWQVDAEPRRLFITELYRTVLKQGMTYAEAVADTKRRFARGDFGEQYRDPRYWGAFVYYGK